MTRRIGHDARVVLMSLVPGAPAVAATLALLLLGDHPLKVTLTVAVGVVVVWLSVPFFFRDRVTGPLRTLATVLEAFREGDYSIRGRTHDGNDALGSAMRELNALGDALRRHRLGALEASTLLERVMASIDVAVFAFDADATLRLINPAGERLLAAHRDPVGRTAADLGLADLLEGDAPRLVASPIAGSDRIAADRDLAGPFELRRNGFRLEGKRHELVVLADVHKALRSQERAAWQRLVRVLGHEINSSLTPIQSISESLLTILRQTDRAADWEDDVRGGLDVVSRRAGGLARFLTAYAKLARLPPPTYAPLDVRAWIARVSALDTRVTVEVAGGPPVTLAADGDQLDQLLINLVKNAVDAALETGGGVSVAWTIASGSPDGGAPTLEVTVEDDGPGILQAENLFVPFFTTKPDGSGIGLALSRQIAEGHGGTLSLSPRTPRGAVARLSIPARRVAEPTR